MNLTANNNNKWCPKIAKYYVKWLRNTADASFYHRGSVSVKDARKLVLAYDTRSSPLSGTKMKRKKTKERSNISRLECTSGRETKK